ncbi:MAG: glycosyltransferase, partial [Acidobacteriota bacterium]
MKILRIIARLNVGGPARHVVWLADGLRDEFEAVLVAGRVPAGEEDMAYVAKAANIQPVFIEEMSRELSPKDIVALYKLFQLMRREKPDLVCTHTAKAGTVGRAAAFLYRWLTLSALVGRPRKLSVTHTFHGHVFHSYYSPFKTKVFIGIEKVLARLATDKIIVISEQQLTEIHHEVGVGRRSQFAVVPLGIDLVPFVDDEAKRRDFRGGLGLDESDLVVGFVGRLTEIKNIPMYLEVAARYQEESGSSAPSVHFVVAGDGHLRADLEQLAEKLGIKNISFVGNRQDVDAVYAGLDIVALTSLNEGTPLSLIEGMASGKPVISTVVGGVTDLIGPKIEEKDGFAIHERGIG